MRKSLTKAEIIRKRSDIRRVFRTSKIFRTNGLHLRITGNGIGWSRVLFAATRGFPSAVERNRAKRLLREIYRAERERISDGLDLAFVIYPGPYEYRDRYSQAVTLLERSGAYRSA